MLKHEKNIPAGTKGSQTYHKKQDEIRGRLSAIVDSSADAIIGKSLDGIITNWNSGAEQLFGYSAKEIIGKSISVLIPQDRAYELSEFISQIKRGVSSVHFETVRIKKNGNLLDVSTIISPIYDDLNILKGFSSVVHDITGRKLVEDEIIKLNRSLEKKNIRSEKRAAELIIANKELAYQNKEKEKRAAELIIANKELAYQNKEKEKRAKALVIANQELAFQNKEKEKRAAELIIANKELGYQNKEKEKRAKELVVANKELAYQNKEKEKRAKELVVANKELAYQNKEKEKRAAELLIANKELEQFSYIASHDLREPLRTVSNYMQVFEEDYLEHLDDNARKYLRAVNNATDRMSILIKSLLDFSRLGKNIKLTYVDCNKLIEDVIADLETLIKTSKAVIEVTGMPKLNLYESGIRQVFQNLIINAIKFQKKGTQPKVQISSKKIKEKWEFSVQDNGIGIDSCYFERIFNIFQRLYTDEKEYEGYGIGLANCKKIIQLHMGEIRVKSKVGRGSTFYFTIPNLIA